VFNERDEEIAVSLAAQAAIAMDNASLYEAELRASAQAKATNEAKDNFIHMLGHELRNPVGSIRTALQVLLASASKKQRDADEARMRAIIERQVDQLARLVDDLLEVSQLSSAKLTLRPLPIDLGELVTESVESMRTRFTASQLTLLWDAPDAPVPVFADPHRIRQILANLLANARKFTDAGGRVEVSLTCENGDAVVSVADTGGGIDPVDLARVFEPFVQTSLARDRMTGGLGLGLPIVKGLIEAQGGSVTVASEGRNRGSKFVVRLPQHLAPLVPKELEESFDAPSPRRILVIDDHFDSADALKRLLDLSGNEVQVAYDGVKGIELAHSFRPDVLICDIGLPGMDGFEVARRLGNDPATVSIHLIALTGFGDQNTIRAAREAGFAHHLTKPVETDVLRRILADV
jgi:CheY-like chemotaxis protein/nitrogen-specific signal transduction histidine kinase